MQFDMNRTWSQAMAMVRANFQLLALIAGIFMLLPSLALVVAMPQLFELAMPGANPEAAQARIQSMLPGFFGAMMGLMLVSLIGYAAMVALMGPERPTVGAAIGRAIRALPSLIGAFLLFLVGYIAAALVAGIVLGLLAKVLSLAVGTGGASALTVIVLILGVGYVFTRLSLLLPVVVLEGARNPFKGFARSWRLTRPARWRIYGFFVLLLIAYAVIFLVLTLAMTALGAAAGGSGTFLFGIVTGIIGMLAAMLISALLVSMHDQLGGAGSPSVAETFE
ncbi:MAG: hypothetical protein ABIT09_01125 [Croceibacterium sp.]